MLLWKKIAWIKYSSGKSEISNTTKLHQLRRHCIQVEQHDLFRLHKRRNLQQTHMRFRFSVHLCFRIHCILLTALSAFDHLIPERIVVSTEINMRTLLVNHKRIVTLKRKTRQSIRCSGRNHPRSQRQLHGLNHIQLRMLHHITEILASRSQKHSILNRDTIRIAHSPKRRQVGRTRKQTAMKRLLRQQIVGRIVDTRHDIDIHGGTQLRHPRVQLLQPRVHAADLDLLVLLKRSVIKHVLVFIGHFLRDQIANKQYTANGTRHIVRIRSVSHVSTQVIEQQLDIRTVSALHLTHF
mmetsp:Transcript_53274/g.85068  ORF Transcript_53274/g.85068 Transcript_53274/m.85068 type:complete len:296 (+) Transcript_53274:172-1059(+)